jgi:hypothetical protein
MVVPPVDCHLALEGDSVQHVRFGVTHQDEDTFTLTWEHGELIRYEDGGANAVLAPDAHRSFATRDLVRWGAPLALARCGHVLLHAATASKCGSRVAFVGRGGAGKSTLVRELQGHGWEQLTDDVLAVDKNARAAPTAEAELRAWCNEVTPKVETTGAIPYHEIVRRLNAKLKDAWGRLDALAFLTVPRSSDRRFSRTQLTGHAVFQRLVEEGFGGSPHPQAWKLQFLVYGALTSSVRAYVVRAPEGIAPMREALDDLDALASAR